MATGPGDWQKALQEALAAARTGVSAAPGGRVALSLLDRYRANQEQFQRDRAQMAGGDAPTGPSIHSIGPIESLLGRVRGAIPTRGPGGKLAGLLDVAAQEITNLANLGPGGAAHAAGILGGTGRRALRVGTEIPEIARFGGAASGVRTVPLADLEPGLQALTRDSKKIRALADEITKSGRIDPLVVGPHGELLNGGHRAAALQLLGETKAPVVTAKQGFRDLNAAARSGANDLPLIAGTEQYAKPSGGILGGATPARKRK